MFRLLPPFFCLLASAFAQSRGPIGDFALLLRDPPAAQSTHSRAELRGAAAQAQIARIRSAQSAVISELRRRKVPVVSSSEVLANAVFVATTPDVARGLASIPGVAHVVFLPKVKRALNTALGLENVSAAWSALGGASNAGANIKIGIIDTGIDQNHAGFQDPSLIPPAGFPKGDPNYTNSKVIVARSYVALDSDSDSRYSSPDDTTPRDRFGHGTAIAMIAAGVENTGPVAAIQGVAPKAFLGNYKVFGSPGVNDGATYAAVHQALEDALADGMDIVTLSLNEGEPVQYGPLDIDQTNCGGACDVFAQAVENAVSNGMVVVAAAGNDGNIGQQPVTLGSIHTPGDAPSAITVGSSTNAHNLYQAVRVGSPPFAVTVINALFDDGPRISKPISGKLVDVIEVGNDGLACTALPSGSLAGSVALIQRGTCIYSDKINNAQNAGAMGVIIYQQSGVSTIYSGLGAQDTGIPAVMVAYADGLSLKGSSGSSVTLDPAWTAVNISPDNVASYSSRGPTPGLYGNTPTSIIKPELVAVGDNLYTATQKLDPNGDGYDATGYAGFSGTSYAVPMVAGAVALVKQKFPSFTPGQLKSAVVNTASTNVNDSGGQARVNSAGGGKLSAGDAINVAGTIEPATLSFGALASSSLPVHLTLKITNVTSAGATFNLTVQQRDPDSKASVTVSPASLTLGAGQSNSVTVTLQGSLPNAGSYEGSIMVSGPSGPTLHVPYQYLVGSGVPYDIYPVYDGSFTGAPNDIHWLIGFRTVDQYGVRIPQGAAVQFGVVNGGGSIAQGDSGTDRLGDAFADVNLGPNTGIQTFSGTAAALTTQFFGYARPVPVIAAGGVGNAAPGGTGQQGLAPGSYISIYGANLADAVLGEFTTSLPVSLAQTNVTFDGGGLSLPGHLQFVSPGQVNVQIPWEYAGQSSVQMKVVTSYLYSALYTVPLAAASPGVFATTDTSYQSITASNPAKRGSTILLFANGLGSVSRPQVSGEPASSAQLVNTSTPAAVSIGGVSAQVAFSGLAPGLVGCYQVNVVIPPNAPTGTEQMVVSVNGVASSPINITVQ
ncbi:MAG TPA: S8 family serine peptidase [Bryobacteraceae bacterium]|nr:S8 family serine peptidase [Bryobacteraceae bacterium]